MRRRSLEAVSGSLYIARETLTGGLTVFSRKSAGALRRRPALAEFNSMRWWPPRSSAREKERWDTRGLTANNDNTGGVEGLSGPRRGRVPQTRRQNSFQRKTVVNRRFTRNAQSRFKKRAGRVLTSTASRRRLERRMQHSADERWGKTAQ